MPITIIEKLEELMRNFLNSFENGRPTNSTRQIGPLVCSHLLDNYQYFRRNIHSIGRNLHVELEKYFSNIMFMIFGENRRYAPRIIIDLDENDSDDEDQIGSDNEDNNDILQPLPSSHIIGINSRLQRAPIKPLVNDWVEQLITRPNIKITDWKEEKPEECPICCGKCDDYSLSCGHYVCSDCIIKNKKATCPCCRQDIALDIPMYHKLYNAIYN